MKKKTRYFIENVVIWQEVALTHYSSKSVTWQISGASEAVLNVSKPRIFLFLESQKTLPVALPLISFSSNR
ncbi:hypothetical protein L1887_28574 [Cichorium endivia]|nr:hypothetical protein L1887_28574 [Cichorium endivia]